jgi:succinyl-diaminopimelate desuccinylase
MEREGASDSRYFSPRGVACIDFGPLGGNIHGPNEYVVIPSLLRAAEFYGRLAQRLATV